MRPILAFLAWMLAVVCGGVNPSMAGEPAACPERLEAWRFWGNVEAGGEWAAQTLQLREDVGVLREVIIRFREESVSREHVRWFGISPTVVPESVVGRLIGAVDDELHAYCRGQKDTEIENLKTRARPRCLIDPEGRTMIMRTALGMVTVTDAEPGRTYPGGLGASVGGEDVDESELDCEPVNKLEIVSDPTALDPFRRGALDFIETMMQRMSAVDEPFQFGSEAVPIAIQILGSLSDRDGERVPDGLPSEFQLEFSGADRPRADSLALARLGDPEGEQKLALELLGYGAGPIASTPLRQVLRSAASAGREETVSLALRALLAADPAVARDEAIPLLSDPRFLRPALGIFALTEPGLSAELSSLDLSDLDATSKAAERVLAHVTSAPHTGR